MDLSQPITHVAVDCDIMRHVPEPGHAAAPRRGQLDHRRSAERVVCVLSISAARPPPRRQFPARSPASNTMSGKVAVFAASCLLVAVSGARVRRDDGYGAPEPDAYGAPAESYGAPVESYGASAPSYGAETGLDLTTIIIPLLALLGLFLLFPTYVTLTNVRRKREAVESGTEVSAVARMMDMYQVTIIPILSPAKVF